jgi:hypothetical protein
MNRKLIAAAAATCLTLGLGASAASASAPEGAGSKGVPVGIQCQQDGIGTLVGAGLIAEAARTGVYVVELNATLPLRTVLEFHRTQPGLFTGGLNVVVGDSDPIPANWCNVPA